MTAEQTIPARIDRDNEEHRSFIFGIMRMFHQAALNGGWWTDLKTGESQLGKRDFIQLVALAIGETYEAIRDGWAPDEKLPHRKAFEVEMADALVRIGDLSGGLSISWERFSEGLRDAELTRFIPLGFDPAKPVHQALAITAVNLHLTMAIEYARKGDDMKRDAEVCKAVWTICALHDAASLDIIGAALEKVAYNSTREDHKPENRAAEGGKKL